MDAILPGAVHSAVMDVIQHIYTFEKYAQPTMVLVPDFLRSQVGTFADAIGFDVDTMNMTLGLFLCYPLGMIMLLLPYGKIKHLFSFVLGAFLLQFTIGVQWVHILITALITYFFFFFLPRRLSKTIVPVFLMTYMTGAHLHRQFINYLGWDMDFSGSQMVITIKLYSLAYNLYDGELLSKGIEDRAAKKCAKYAVKDLPGIIEFLGYVFSFSNILAGPAYEYKIYEAACDGTLLYDKNGKPKGKIPSNFLPTLKPFLISIFCMVMFVVGSGKYPLLDPTNPQSNIPVVLTEEMLAKPWIARYAYAWLALFFIRQKYYFAWKIAEGSNNLWYAGFEGFDEKGEVIGWDNASNTNILAFETAPNVKTLSAEWNKKTANWLSRYIYIRTGGSLFATYSLSAFWHGFYPGYYFFFLSVPILTACERIGRKKLSPRFSTGSKWSPWGVVCFLSTSFLVNYMVMSFQLLAFDWGLSYWKSQYFFGHIVCLVFYVVVSNMKTPKKKEL